ncbi:MAG: P-loop NTPase [Microthrixaceae bacterium]
MWRGLILNRAVQHFIEDVAWGDLDYLLIDMPPGTGDVQMGLAKMLPRSEMIVVTTPSLNAQKVAMRVLDMGRKNFLRIVGVIENMTSFIDDRGIEHRLFGSGGGEALASEAGVPLLGKVPIEAEVADGGDHGRPAVLGNTPAAEELRRITKVLVDEYVPPMELSTCSGQVLRSASRAIVATTVGHSSRDRVVQVGSHHLTLRVRHRLGSITTTAVEVPTHSHSNNSQKTCEQPVRDPVRQPQ